MAQASDPQALQARPREDKKLHRYMYACDACTCLSSLHIAASDQGTEAVHFRSSILWMCTQQIQSSRVRAVPSTTSMSETAFEHALSLDAKLKKGCSAHHLFFVLLLQVCLQHFAVPLAFAPEAPQARPGPEVACCYGFTVPLVVSVSRLV